VSPPTDTALTFWFRCTAGATVFLAAISALITAAVDTANVTTRFRETVFDGRPYWLHTFSIAMITAIVGTAALFGSSRLMWSLPARLLYGITAALDLTVPIVRRRHREYRLAIPGVHVGLAVLLVGLIVLAVEGSAGARRELGRPPEPPGESEGKEPGKIQSEHLGGVR
jgi:hypothetical protein